MTQCIYTHIHTRREYSRRMNEKPKRKKTPTQMKRGQDILIVSFLHRVNRFFYQMKFRFVFRLATLVEHVCVDGHDHTHIHKNEMNSCIALSDTMYRDILSIFVTCQVPDESLWRWKIGNGTRVVFWSCFLFHFLCFGCGKRWRFGKVNEKFGRNFLIRCWTETRCGRS